MTRSKIEAKFNNFLYSLYKLQHADMTFSSLFMSLITETKNKRMSRSSTSQLRLNRISSVPFRIRLPHWFRARIVMSNKLRAVIGLILCLCLFFYSPNFSNNKSKALPSIASPRASLNRFVYAHLPFTISSYPRLPFITSTPKKFKESINPFEQAGRLVIDEKELQNNQWKPFKSAASHIM